MSKLSDYNNPYKPNMVRITLEVHYHYAPVINMLHLTFEEFMIIVKHFFTKNYNLYEPYFAVGL